MLDDIPVRQPVISKAGDIDLMGSLAAAGQADISLARFARPVHHTADDRDGDRHVDMLQTLLDHLYRFDDIELLARAGGTGNDRHTAAAQSQRFQHFISDPHLFGRVRRQRHTYCVADAGPQKPAKTNR